MSPTTFAYSTPTITPGNYPDSLCVVATPPPPSLPPRPDVGHSPTPGLPQLSGLLVGPLTWFIDSRELNPLVEVAQCRIRVRCRQCGDTSTHGWKLDGTLRREEKVLHCGCSHAWIMPRGGRGHTYAPTLRLERPVDRKLRRLQGTSAVVLKGSWLSFADSPGLLLGNAALAAREVAAAVKRARISKGTAA